jgi:RNA polymerase sigma-70 factor (ECF subfamily)
MSDGELVRRTLAGRAEAFEELVRRWAGRVTALCHAKVGCAAAADDLAQEAFLRGYRALATLVDPEKFGAWLCRIAQHACLNWHKARQRAPLPFSALGPSQRLDDRLAAQGDHAGGEADREDLLHQLRAEIAALPAVYREILVLYYHRDVTYRDLGELLGVSAATVNARLTKARALLRERFGAWRR